MDKQEKAEHIPEDVEQVKDEVLGRMIGLGLLAFEFSEEKLVEKLSRLNTRQISKATLDIVQDILVEHEAYELANVVKTHLEYNYENVE